MTIFRVRVLPIRSRNDGGIIELMMVLLWWCGCSCRGPRGGWTVRQHPAGPVGVMHGTAGISPGSTGFVRRRHRGGAVTAETPSRRATGLSPRVSACNGAIIHNKQFRTSDIYTARRLRSEKNKCRYGTFPFLPLFSLPFSSHLLPSFLPLPIFEVEPL